MLRTNRDRARAWSATHRSVSRSNPWLRGAPLWPHRYLPGGACSIEITPRLRWPLEHRNLRLLHGALSHLAGIPHDRACPAFALVPVDRGCGWYVHWWHEEIAARLAGRAHAARIARQDVQIRLGPVVWVRAPETPRRGRRLVRIDTVTPVVISRGGDQSRYTAPTTDRLVSTLTNNAGQRYGLATRLGLTPQDTEDVRIELVERATEPATVRIGGHVGTVRGWSGTVVVETNASARWLLQCAERGLGLGARTAFGFGRIRLSDL